MHLPSLKRSTGTYFQIYFGRIRVCRATTKNTRQLNIYDYIVESAIIVYYENRKYIIYEIPYDKFYIIPPYVVYMYVYKKVINLNSSTEYCSTLTLLLHYYAI